MRELIIISGKKGTGKTSFAKNIYPYNTVEYSSFKKYLSDMYLQKKLASILIDDATLKDFTLLKIFMSENKDLKDIRFIFVTNLSDDKVPTADRIKNRFDFFKHIKCY